ncbi:hypothetical protein AB3N61_09295 [Leptospira sp. WS58.C1]|uniref:hypothetical protein n=1 Tax=Leptospira cinconiae TaxID=3235173 RepID=UPI00349E5334
MAKKSKRKGSMSTDVIIGGVIGFASYLLTGFTAKQVTKSKSLKEAGLFGVAICGLGAVGSYFLPKWEWKLGGMIGSGLMAFNAALQTELIPNAQQIKTSLMLAGNDNISPEMIAYLTANGAYNSGQSLNGYTLSEGTDESPLDGYTLSGATDANPLGA